MWYRLGIGSWKGRFCLFVNSLCQCRFLVDLAVVNLVDREQATMKICQYGGYAPMFWPTGARKMTEEVSIW